ncbi:MAG: phage protease [Victivallaceae bacterium]|nr:phage protease [Victivallaceae bacterium]
MPENHDYQIYDGLALGAEAALESVDGVPRAWRLLRVGANALEISGKKLTLTLSAENIAQIVDRYKARGEKIPLDSRHTLYLAAEKFSVDEAAVAKLLPHGTATLGYADLEARADGLWVANAEFIPLAAEIVKAGIFKYFSPVVRGLNDGNLRVTSVALDNVPALNKLEAIAASAERLVNPKQEVKMTKVEEALAKLLGKKDALALGGETDDAALAAEINAKGADLQGKTELIAVLKEVLQLPDTMLPADLRTKLQTLVDTAASAPQLAAKAETAALSAERTRGLAEGKLTNAMLETEPWKSFTSAAMSAYLSTAPVVVPVGSGGAAEAQKRDNAVALSAEASKIFDVLGLTGDVRKKAEEGLKNG